MATCRALYRVCARRVSDRRIIRAMPVDADMTNGMASPAIESRHTESSSAFVIDSFLMEAWKEKGSLNLFPIGQIAYVDQDGLLPRISHRDALVPWAEPLDAACEAVRETLAHKASAVLLRGSIPRGTAVAGVSDLDMVIVHTGEVGNQERARLEARGQAISTRYPMVTDVEFLAVPEQEFWCAPRRRWLRFILSHQGLLLAGDDVMGRLPPPRLDGNAVAHDHPGASWMSDWVGHWHDAGSDAERQNVCAWLMKRYVRAAFERIMFDVNGYTRDLYPAAEAISDRCTTYADAVWDACRLAVFPSSDGGTVHRTASAIQALLNDSAMARREARSSLCLRPIGSPRS